MNKRARFLLAAGTTAGIAIFVTPAPQAEQTELDCTAKAPCTAPQHFALQPDGPDGGAEIKPPPGGGIVTVSGPSGPATPLPPGSWMNDTMTMPLRRPAWRPRTQEDGGWLAYAAMHAQTTAAEAANSG
jgi:hypothetical protein